MKNFLSNNKNRMGALLTILVLAVGSISIIGTSQFVMGSDGGNINGSIIACVYGACKDNTFNGGTSSSGGGGGGGGQPTPTTATLIVTKVISDPQGFCSIPHDKCSPSDFTITVTDDNPTPASFKGSGPPGTEVTLGPGKYTVSEDPVSPGFTTFSGDCKVNAGGTSASGTIAAGDKQTCTITNPAPPSP